MANTPSASGPHHSRLEGYSLDASNLVDFSQDPLHFFPSSLPDGPWGVSIPTHLVEEAILELEQRSDVDFNFMEPDMGSGDRYGLLKVAYNDLLRLYRQTQSHLEKLTEEHADCKSRLKKLSEEHARLTYVLIILFFHLIADHFTQGDL